MRHISLLTLAVAATLSGPALAAPEVIQGIGPSEAQRMYGAQPYAPAPVVRQVERPTRVAQHAGSAYGAASAYGNTPNYGGGFIEMLVTGSNPAPRGNVYYNEPQGGQYAPRSAYSPIPNYGAVPTPAYVTPPGPTYGPAPTAIYNTNQPIGRAPRARQVAFNAGERQSANPFAGAGADYDRTEVSYDGGHGAGTIVVDTPNKHLYLVQGGGRAIRYGIGVGRPGFEWSGVKHITRKAQWPEWTPPPEMLKRRPDIPHFVKGGENNPLGARAMYLGSSLYRIHGTNEPSTIGQNVSSGCIRMMNEDVIDLYNRVGVGTKVIVM